MPFEKDILRRALGRLGRVPPEVLGVSRKRVRENLNTDLRLVAQLPPPDATPVDLTVLRRPLYVCGAMALLCVLIAGGAVVRWRLEKRSAATLVQSHSKHGETSGPVRALQPATVRDTYSAGVKLALAARGEADLYVNTYANFHDWDICAGHILVAEAGGQVTGLKGQPIQYGSPVAAQRMGLLASNGKLHEAALGRLRDLF